MELIGDGTAVHGAPPRFSRRAWCAAGDRARAARRMGPAAVLDPRRAPARAAAACAAAGPKGGLQPSREPPEPRRSRCGPEGLRVQYGTFVPWPVSTSSFASGEVTAVMGRNGSREVLAALGAPGQRCAFRRHCPLIGRRSPYACDGSDSARQTRWIRTQARPKPSVPTRLRRIALVPQTPADLLYLDTVVAECREADRAARPPPGPRRSCWSGSRPASRTAHPHDLSEGQRLALVLAVQLAGSPRHPASGRADARPRLCGETTAVRLLGEADRGRGNQRAALQPRRRVRRPRRRPGRPCWPGGEIIADGPVPEVLTATRLCAAARQDPRAAARSHRRRGARHLAAGLDGPR